MPGYPALEIQQPNVVGNYLGGMQQAQQMQGEQIRNTFMQQQQQQQQQAMQRDEQFRNILAQSVGPMAAGAAQAPGDGTSNYLMQGTQNPFGPDPSAINELMQLDPERAMQFQQAFEQQRQQQQAEMRERAGVSVRAAQFVLKSKDPKLTLELGFPEMVEQLKTQGIELDDLDDDAVREMADNVIAHFGPIAGIEPGKGPESPFAKLNPADYTPDSVKSFEASGNFSDLVAREKPGDDPNDKMFTRTTALRKEFTSQEENWQTIRSAYANVENAEDGEPGDTQLMTNFMRVIAPGIRVQPGQELDSQNLPGSVQTSAAIWNKFVNDGKLDTKDRAKIRSQAKRTYETQQRLAKENRARYTKLAEKDGIDPWSVVGDDTPMGGSGSGGGGDLSNMSDDDLLKALNGG